MNKRDTFIFYRSIYESAKELSDEDRLMLYDAVIEYSLNFKAKKLVGLPRAFFELVKPVLSKGNTNYINGSKAKQKRNGSETEGYKDKDKDKDKNKYKEKDKDTAFPTLSKAQSFMDIKEYLEGNAKQLSIDFEFEFEDRLVKVSPAGKLYDAKEVDDLIQIDFKLETRALKYLLNNKGIIK